MRVVRSERTIFVDVDETLVMHEKPIAASTKDSVLVVCSINAKDTIEVWKNNPMIRLVKDEHNRGSYIIVWSKGGFNWARAVVEELQLMDYVDLVMTKPFAYFDDKDVSEWMKDRVYIESHIRYKQTK